MTIIFQNIITMILHLKRTCPKCGRDQVVTREQRRETVRCRYCNEEIPPPRH